MALVGTFASAWSAHKIASAKGWEHAAKGWEAEAKRLQEVTSELNEENKTLKELVVKLDAMQMPIRIVELMNEMQSHLVDRITKMWDNHEEKAKERHVVTTKNTEQFMAAVVKSMDAIERRMTRGEDKLDEKFS